MFYSLTFLLVLDPRIMYKGLKEEYSNDEDLLQYLENAKTQLQDHYHNHYANTIQRSAAAVPEPTLQSMDGSPQKFSFIARYRQKNRQVIDELESFLKDVPEPFNDCHPLQWWFGRCSQYPNLYCLARNILAIPGELLDIQHYPELISEYPGSAVAVERVFSGGRDTISL
jgi:hypothetical protein